MGGESPGFLSSDGLALTLSGFEATLKTQLETYDTGEVIWRVLDAFGYRLGVVPSPPKGLDVPAGAQPLVPSGSFGLHLKPLDFNALRINPRARYVLSRPSHAGISAGGGVVTEQPLPSTAERLKSEVNTGVGFIAGLFYKATRGGPSMTRR